MAETMIFRSLRSWMSYLDVACPTKPADYAGYMAALRAKLTMPAGLGTVATIDGAGHYPHAQYPDQVAALALPFLASHAHA